MWYMHTVEYYSALKKKETLHYVTTWMTLEDIMPREIRQSQKNKYCLISPIRGNERVKLTEARNRTVVAGCGRGMVVGLPGGQRLGGAERLSPGLCCTAECLCPPRCVHCPRKALARPDPVLSVLPTIKLERAQGPWGEGCPRCWSLL